MSLESKTYVAGAILTVALPSLRGKQCSTLLDRVSNFSLDAAQIKYQQARLLHWNEVARKLETWTGWGGYYHRRLTASLPIPRCPGAIGSRTWLWPWGSAGCAQAGFRRWSGFFRGDDSRGKTAASPPPLCACRCACIGPERKIRCDHPFRPG